MLRQRLGYFLLCWCCWNWQVMTLSAQTGDELRPSAFTLGEPAGFFQYRPGCWGIVAAEVWNPTDRPVRLLAVTTFEMDKTVQYGREFLVPARAKRKVSYPIRIPDKIDEETRRLDLVSRLYDRTDGKDTLLRRANDPMWHKSSVRAFSRSSITGYYADYAQGAYGLKVGDEQFYKLTEEALDPVLETIKVTRRYMNIKDWRQIPTLDENDDLPWPLALDSVDQLVLGGNRLATEPEAREAIRGWLNQGGRLWIMLDKTDISTINLLLGDAFPGYPVDRVALSQYTIVSHGDALDAEPELRQVEIPVELIRVVTEGVEVTHSVDGWPAAFWQQYGHGEILFTAMDLRGWSRPRRELIIRPRGIQGQVLDTVPLQQLAERFFEEPKPPRWSATAFQAYIGEKIGYQIVTKEWIITILGSYCTILLLAGLWLLRVGQLDRLLWVGPVAAIGTALMLGTLGRMSRESVLPTVAVAQWIAPVDQSQFVPVNGMAAIYNQRKSEEMIGVRKGGVLWPESSGSDQATRRLVWTDHGRAQWENLTLPEGVRETTFQQVITVKQPLGAHATVLDKGLTGHLQVGPFKQISDALLVTPAGDRYTVHVEGDQFRSGPADLLKKEEYFGDSLLIEDEQRHRQQVLGKLLGTATGVETHFPRQPTILAWAKPLEVGLTFPEDHQRLGSALLALPLNLDPTPRGKAFVLPPWLCRVQAISGRDGSRSSELYNNELRKWGGKIFEGRRIWLRIQLPRQVLPATLAGAVVTMDVEFHEFDLQVLLPGDDSLQPVKTLVNPNGTQTVTIDQSDLLQLDVDGGLTIVVQIAPGKEQNERGVRDKSYSWQMRDFYLEVTGKRLAL